MKFNITVKNEKRKQEIKVSYDEENDMLELYQSSQQITDCYCMDGLISRVEESIMEQESALTEKDIDIDYPDEIYELAKKNWHICQKCGKRFQKEIEGKEYYCFDCLKNS